LAKAGSIANPSAIKKGSIQVRFHFRAGKRRYSVCGDAIWKSHQENVMPAGASPKREREYDELKGRFKKEGRYKGREKQVAARIVNKQRAQYGETKEEKRKDKRGASPDRNLPIRDYQHLTVRQITRKLDDLSKSEIRQVERYEKKHKNRKTLLEKLEAAA
jgi:hypothetical protein